MVGRHVAEVSDFKENNENQCLLNPTFRDLNEDIYDILRRFSSNFPNGRGSCRKSFKRSFQRCFQKKTSRLRCNSISQDQATLKPTCTYSTAVA